MEGRCGWMGVRCEVDGPMGELDEPFDSQLKRLHLYDSISLVCTATFRNTVLFTINFLAFTILR